MGMGMGMGMGMEGVRGHLRSPRVPRATPGCAGRSRAVSACAGRRLRPLHRRTGAERALQHHQNNTRLVSAHGLSFKARESSPSGRGADEEDVKQPQPQQVVEGEESVSPALSSSVLHESGSASPTRAREAYSLGWPRNLEERYQIGEELGRGSFGVVRKAKDREKNMMFAIKTIPKIPEKRKRRGMTAATPKSKANGGEDERVRLARRQKEKLLAEVSFMVSLSDCPFSAQLVAFYEDDTHAHLVCELCEGGDLRKFMQQRKEKFLEWEEKAKQRSHEEHLHDGEETMARRLSSSLAGSLSGRKQSGALAQMFNLGKQQQQELRPSGASWVLSEDETRDIMCQVLQFIEHCHSKGIVFSDVKPANFMLKFEVPPEAAPAPALVVKGIDFGCSQRLNQEQSNHEMLIKRTGTPAYWSPEVFMRFYDDKADLWSCGMMMYELMVGKLPFWDEIEKCTPRGVQRGVLQGEFDDKAPAFVRLSSEAKDLITRLVDRSPDTRITLQEAMQHPFILGATNRETNFFN
mmetsp:Transcript_7480/g.19205  ORF Transcript_7480/g.19205 Transcript_7480/m.19205 type:complete len:522 (+) Transcript_7480:2-1567(+)